MSAENLSTYSEQLKDVYNPTKLIVTGAALSAVALAAVTETAMTAHNLRQLKTDADMAHMPSSADHSFYVVPGCRADGRFITNTLGEALLEHGSVHGVVYPQRGLPLNQMKEQLLETRRRDANRPASFYVVSMGGMVLTHLLSDEEFRHEFGPIDRVVFDSSPSGSRDLTPSIHSAMTAAALMPHSFSMAHLYKKVVNHKALHTENSPDDSKIYREHILTTAATPLPAVVAQTRFIRGRQFVPGELSSASGVVDEMLYVSSAQDDVVDVHSAVSRFNAIYDRDIPHIIDTTRANPSHAAGVEHPELIVNLLTGNNDKTDDYKSLQVLAQAA